MQGSNTATRRPDAGDLQPNWTPYADNPFSPLKQRVQGLAVAVPSSRLPLQGASLLCPLSPTKGPAAARPSTSVVDSASDGGLSALHAALSSLGVKLNDTRPATAAAAMAGYLASAGPAAGPQGAAPNSANRKVLDISADIQRTVDSLNSIGSRLDRESSRCSNGDEPPAGLHNTARSATSIGGASHCSTSPRRLLEDASQQQVEQLRRELWKLNRAILINSRPSTAASAGPPAAAAGPGTRPSTTADAEGAGMAREVGGHDQPPPGTAMQQTPAPAPCVAEQLPAPSQRGAPGGVWAQTAAAVAAEGSYSRLGPTMAPLSTFVQNTGQVATPQTLQRPASSMSVRPPTAADAPQGPLTAVASLRSLTAWQQQQQQQQQPSRRRLPPAQEEPQQQQHQTATQHWVRPPSAIHKRSDSGSSMLFAQPSVQQLRQDSPDPSDPQQLQAEVESLQRALHAKEQSEAAALAALRQLTQSSQDERQQALQQQVRELRQQLLARDQALAATELQLQQQQPGAAAGAGGIGRGSSPGSPGSERQLVGHTIDMAVHRRVVETLGERSLQVQQLQDEMEQLQQQHQQQQAALMKRAETYRKQLLQVRGELDLRNAEVQQLQDELAAGAAAPTRDAAQPRHLQQQLQQRAAEVQQLQAALQQVYEAVAAADPSWRQQADSSSGGGSNLALLLQQRLQELLAERSSAVAEVAELREQLAGYAAAEQAGPAEVQQLHQSNNRLTHELQEAAGKLEAAEQQLVDHVDVKQQHSRLQEQLAQAVQEREQQKQYIQILQRQQQQLLQQLPDSRPSAVRLIGELQQQVAVAAVELQQVKQQQERAAAAAAAGAEGEAAHGQQQQQQEEPERLSGDLSLMSLRALVSQSRRSSQHQLLPAPGPAAEQQQAEEVAALRQQCSELTRQLSAAQQQLGALESKEARLQAANAQLQEQLCSLKVSTPAAPTSSSSTANGREAPHSDLRSSAAGSKPGSDDLAPEVDSVTSRVGLLLSQLGDRRQQVDTLAQQLSAERMRADQLQEDKQQLETELQQWRIHADALEADVADLQEQAVEARDTHPLWVAERTRLDGVMAEKEAALSETRQELASVRAQLKSSKDLVTQLEYEISTGASDYDSLLRRHQQLEGQHGKAQEALAELRQRLEGLTGPAGPTSKARLLQQQLNQVQRRVEQAEQELAASRQQQEDLSKRLAAKEEEVLALEGQVAVLEQELGRREGS